MKSDIHPKTNLVDAKCTSCNYTMQVLSTIPEIKVEICGNCHPFYTGKQKFIDTAGKVDKFNKIQSAAKQKRGA